MTECTETWCTLAMESLVPVPCTRWLLHSRGCCIGPAAHKASDLNCIAAICRGGIEGNWPWWPLAVKVLPRNDTKECHVQEQFSGSAKLRQLHLAVWTLKASPAHCMSLCCRRLGPASCRTCIRSGRRSRMQGTPSMELMTTSQSRVGSWPACPAAS